MFNYCIVIVNVIIVVIVIVFNIDLLNYFEQVFNANINDIINRCYTFTLQSTYFKNANYITKIIVHIYYISYYQL